MHILTKCRRRVYVVFLLESWFWMTFCNLMGCPHHITNDYAGFSYLKDECLTTCWQIRKVATKESLERLVAFEESENWPVPWGPPSQSLGSHCKMVPSKSTEIFSLLGGNHSVKMRWHDMTIIWDEMTWHGRGFAILAIFENILFKVVLQYAILNLNLKGKFASYFENGTCIDLIPKSKYPM